MGACLGNWLQACSVMLQKGVAPEVMFTLGSVSALRIATFTVRFIGLAAQGLRPARLGGLRMDF